MSNLRRMENYKTLRNFSVGGIALGLATILFGLWSEASGPTWLQELHFNIAMTGLWIALVSAVFASVFSNRTYANSGLPERRM